MLITIRSIGHTVLAGTAVWAAAACAASRSSVARPSAGVSSVAAPPNDYVTVPLRTGGVTFWPYATDKLSVTSPDDPINLIFAGEGDPRAIRAALMHVDGDRSGSPLANVTCTWSDAEGTEQASAAPGIGWTGSAIQLACGEFGPVRYHLRLFDVGPVVVANAHFELQIPGTADHQALSYNLARDLVSYDMRRTGLLAQSPPVKPSALITPVPYPYQTIPPQIYNLLPAELRAIVGGPASDVTTPVAIASDGKANIIQVARHYIGPVVGSRHDFVIELHQAVPKPLCVDPTQPLVFVSGAVHFVITTNVSRDGTVTREENTTGGLTVTPLDSRGRPAGAPYRAQVSDTHRAWATGTRHESAESREYRLFPASTATPDLQLTRFRVGSEVPPRNDVTEQCGH